MTTGQDEYMKQLQEAQRREAARKAAEDAQKKAQERAVQQAFERGVAPSDMTEDIVAAAMKGKHIPPPPSVQKAQYIATRSIQKDQRALQSGRGFFATDAAQKDYGSKTQKAMEILNQPGTPANTLATAIILAQFDRGLNPVPANVYENVRATERGYVSIIGSEDIAEKLLDMGCHAEIYVDKIT